LTRLLKDSCKEQTHKNRHQTQYASDGALVFSQKQAKTTKKGTVTHEYERESQYKEERTKKNAQTSALGSGAYCAQTSRKRKVPRNERKHTWRKERDEANKKSNRYRQKERTVYYGV
jgi:hypothetical protein